MIDPSPTAPCPRPNPAFVLLLRPVFVPRLLFPLLLPLPSPPTSPPPSPLSSYLSSSLLLLLLPLSFYNVSQCDLLTWESVAKLEMPLERLLNELRVSWFAVRTVRGRMTIMIRCTELFWRSVIIAIVLSPPSGSGAVSLWYPRLSWGGRTKGYRGRCCGRVRMRPLWVVFLWCHLCSSCVCSFVGWLTFVNFDVNKVVSVFYP